MLNIFMLPLTRPLFICMLVVFCVLCLCGICNNGCQSQSRSAPPSPSPRGIPMTDMWAPPPYSEVTSKPFLYPPSDASPPSYHSVIQDQGTLSLRQGES
ncbi:hypothetical protein XELAEV_18046057mg [Xenopus laevis]|uniref:Uncharacterized protein n=1 Tax=Xenopus laevis TaxID=8355 RepID=A0A974BSG5_XENLA|nr:hypothetical protein XELAEV_18046057mg [Xenopus laevis]